MNLGLIDGLDGGVSISVGSQKHAPGVGVEIHGPANELNACHLGHALVNQQQTDGAIPPLESLQSLERSRSRVSTDNPVAFGIPSPQVAVHRTQHLRVIVDSQQDRFYHWIASATIPREGSG